MDSGCDHKLVASLRQVFLCFGETARTRFSLFRSWIEPFPVCLAGILLGGLVHRIGQGGADAFSLAGAFPGVRSVFNCDACLAGCGVERVFLGGTVVLFYLGHALMEEIGTSAPVGHTAVFGRNESSDGAGRFREARENAVCRRNRKRAPRRFEALFRKQSASGDDYLPGSRRTLTHLVVSP